MTPKANHDLFISPREMTAEIVNGTVIPIEESGEDRDLRIGVRDLPAETWR